MNIKIKRIYDPAEESDGKRVLVDRLWPRGVSKEKARLDLWLKNVAPDSELRKWFGHKPENFPAFADRYRRELAEDPEKREAGETLLNLARTGRVTLLYGAKDPSVNHAAVLRDYLTGVR